ncbi:MAG: hypothetical protein A3C35_07290 [Omnitrophica bacterium RIFCSPHIGHO2_02_FULL_46_11]|nr:MAG: hypothetical protein A3C35_07290 [Omnitrophica bacterium RIFCSPHIGHO2_02_FULL_46_11]OGW87372.1 MAG: hypothetical protein A3A81_04600 [Omnitrophica bacterium RIFCSPLOWO2_01_FULL_45_10b]
MGQNLIFGALVLGVSLYLLSTLTLAEEAAKPNAASAVIAPAEETDETEFSYGTVKSVSANQIVLSEYDYDADKDVDVTYTINANTKFENAKSPQEIAVGDAIDIDFTVQGAQKTASTISVEKATDDTDDFGLEVEGEKADLEQQVATATR